MESSQKQIETHLQVKSTSFIITIANFSSITSKNGVYSITPLFQLYKHHNHMGCELTMYVRGNSIIIEMAVTEKNSPAKKSYNFNIVRSDGQLCSLPLIHSMNSTHTNCHCTYLSRTHIMHKASQLLHQDKLTLLLVIENIMHALFNSVPLNPTTSKPQEVQTFIDTGKFSDITIVVKPVHFRAHKFVLAARSDVFNAIFTYKTMDMQFNCVEIVDLDIEVVQEMLRYIYTDTVHNMEETVSGLLAAADKYNLKGLTRMCEEHLYTHLTVETAVTTLLLARIYDLSQLLETTKSFIADNKIEIYSASPLQ